MVITVEPAEAHPGETVLVTYSVESAAPLTMLDGQISLPEESLEIQSYTEDFKSYGFPPLAMDGDTVNGYNPSAKQLTLAIGQATSNNWTVMTFTCKVKDNAALGSITVGFNNPEVDDGASLTVKPTTIKVVHAGEHTFVDDTDNAQNKAATCTEDGVMYQKCSIDGCDATTTRSVPATGHSYDNGVETMDTPRRSSSRSFRTSGPRRPSGAGASLPTTA